MNTSVSMVGQKASYESYQTKLEMKAAQSAQENTTAVNAGVSAGSVTVTATQLSVNVDQLEISAAGNQSAAASAADESETALNTGTEFQVDVDALIEENNKRMQDFTAKLLSMVSQKGATAGTALGDEATTTVQIFGMNLEVTQEDIDEAKASISEGGEWSVEAVSDRIMNMAYALSGGDESKLSTLKAAVQQGFKEAGFDVNDYSSMPEITGQTYDEIMSRFDDWEQNGMKPYGQDTKNAAVSASTVTLTETTVSVSGSYVNMEA